MFVTRSFTHVRLSITTRMAIVSFVVGYIGAVAMVSIFDTIGSMDWTRSSKMFVNDDDADTSLDVISLASGHHQPPQQHIAGHHDDRHHAIDHNVKLHPLSDTIRILCVIITTADVLRAKVELIQATWGRRCTKLIFVSDKVDPTAGVTVVRINSSSTTMAAFDHIIQTYADEADWFLQADDETYIIMENLRYFLSSLNPNDPIYFRHHFSAAVQQGFLGTTTGYLVSKEALRRLGTRQSIELCNAEDSVEDRLIGRCLRSLGVKTSDSRDALGRSRFHCFAPEKYIHGGFPHWYNKYNKNSNVHVGIDTISDYAISFHFVEAIKFYELEFYIYQLRPYGHVTGFLQLNSKPS